MGVLLSQDVQFREQQCDFGEQNFANSLYFSLLAGNFGGEELAPDCALRQTVWAAEKIGSLVPKTAQNRSNSSTFALKLDQRKCLALPSRKFSCVFSLNDRHAVRFQRLRRANAIRSQNRWCGESDLTCQHLEAPGQGRSGSWISLACPMKTRPPIVTPRWAVRTSRSMMTAFW